MNRLNRRLLSALAACAATLSACYQIQVTANAGPALLAVSGDIGYYEKDAVGGGSTFPPVIQDIDSAFGVGNTEVAPFGSVSVDVGVPVLTISSFRFASSGEGELQEGFGGLPNGTPVRSDFEVLDVKATYVFGIPVGPVSIAPGVGMDFLDMKLRVVNQINPGEVQTADLTVPLPYGVVRAEYAYRNRLRFTAEVGYMQADFDDYEARLVQAEAMATYHLSSSWHVFLGYRHLVLDAKADLDGDFLDAKFAIQGPMVGGGFRF
jgi:hypothetical protein